MSDANPHDNLLKEPGLETAIMVPNLLLLLVIVLYVLTTKVGPDRVQPLVVADKETSARIRQLERLLARNPEHRKAALELARLYRRAGQLPFSYDALRSAEQNGSRAARFRMKLGMAYVEIGKNADGVRVLREALLGCRLRRCPAHIEARLSIFKQVADLIAERGINARLYPDKASKVFDEVLKKVDGRFIGPLRRQAQAAKTAKSAKPAKATKKGGSSSAPESSAVAR